MHVAKLTRNGLALCMGVLILAALCSVAAADTSTPVSLAGRWRFELDPNNAGVTESWFAKSLPEVVKLPGSTDENKKGTPNDRKPDMQRLSRLYEYTGAAWYQRDITIPPDWKGKRITLFLERCHWETQVWLDGKPCAMQDSLCTPHIHELGADLQPGDHHLTIRVDNTIKYNIGGWSHSITEETQTNWNGIVGRIELRATPATWIESVQVYPDVASQTIKVKASVHSASKAVFELALAVSQAQPIVLRYGGFVGEKTIETEIPVHGGKTWDEFSPTLHELTTTLTVAGQQDVLHTSFGMRDFSVRKKRLMLNGRKVFIRGTLECCIFPHTGYPPTDVNSWLRIFKICQSYGLNSMRFHSWCPPEAAFTAADQMGFLLQVEAPFWAFNVGKEPVRDQFIEAEVRRILDTYGNHPSFGMLCMGNELKGDTAFLQKLALLGKELDPRHLYTSSTAWSFGPNDMYNVKAVRGLHGPTTDVDFAAQDAESTVPIISHEISQWAVFPDLAEIPKYDGVLRARNFELLRDNLRKKHMLDQAAAFTQASGKLSAELYKEEIEVLLRTPGHGGFQILDLHDFPGQGTAVVGMLDAFWDSKGLITPSAFRRFCGPTVPLLRIAKRTYTTDETLTARVQVAHFGPTDIANAIPEWSIVDSKGSVVASGMLPARNLPTGDVSELGSISVSLSRITAPSKLTVTVSLKDTEFSNEWHIWVYPARANIDAPKDVLVTSSPDEAVTALKAGRKALVLADRSSLVKSRPGSFNPVFWSPILFAHEAAKGMGVLCDPRHPALAAFPTDSYTNWQWYDLLTHSHNMVLDGTPAGFRPIVQIIDNFTKNQKLGNLLEARVGDGRLIVCSVDLSSDLDNRFVARQLLSSLLSYMGSPAFAPRQPLTFAELATFLGKAPQTNLQSLTAKVISVDSVDNVNIASNAIDGDPETFWDTQWGDDNPPYPHQITIDMQKPIDIAGFRYLPRQDMSNGWFADYEFYVSEDGTDWGVPAAKGTFTADAKEKTITLAEPRHGRFIRLVALTGVAGKPWAAIAELDIIRPR